MFEQNILLKINVEDFCKAIEFYTKKLNFILIEDIIKADTGKRWVMISPPNSRQIGIVLVKKKKFHKNIQNENIYKQKTFLCLDSIDFWEDYYKMISAEIEFIKAPKYCDFGIMASFSDLDGNFWNLLQSDYKNIFPKTNVVN